MSNKIEYVKVWKAGKYKVVPEDHPDTKRMFKVPVKAHYKNKKKWYRRSKQIDRLMPIAILPTTTWD